MLARRGELPLADFTREHVLSQAFGRFANTPVLHNSVCGDCNQFFGDVLETPIARGAFEGMLRYRRGTRVPRSGSLNFKYLEFTLPDGSTWSGVRLKLIWQDGHLVADLITQAAFFDRAKSKWVHFTKEEIESGTLSETPTLERNKGRIYARSLVDRDEILSLLRQNGIGFGEMEDMNLPADLFDGEDISVQVTFTINKGIRRCIAKYSFNFLAFVCGSDFVLAKDFDVVRRFIRYGDAAAYPIVAETVQPILRDDSSNRRQTSGHLLTVSWAGSGLHLVGQVSLFNSITYSVSLARHYSALWRPIRSGLHFNIPGKTIQPLIPSSALLLPY